MRATKGHPISTLAAFLLVLLAPAASAQNQYARTPGDTLRYHESTDVDITVDAPQGTFDLEAASRGSLALTFATADSVRAWFTELNVSSTSPMGSQAPNTDDVIHEPFTLRFAADGRVEAVETPTVPAALRTISDVRRQFEDFFFILPEEELHEGYSWEYEVSVEDVRDGEGTHSFTKTGTFTVVGDTTLDGRHALVITGDLNSTLDVTMSDASNDVTVTNAFSGIERNRIAFDPEEGVMVLRERQADLSGTSEYEGGPMPMSLRQQIQYDSEIRLQR